MHNWTNFCNIIKFNLKSKSLVAHVATGLFLDDVVCKKLIDKETFVVPPEIDASRNLKFANVNKIDDTKFEFSIHGDDQSLDILVGKSLIISDEDMKLIFGELFFKNNNKLIGKIVIDDNLGQIGNVKDVAGTSAQKHLIVAHNGEEVLVPYVEEFIEEENKNEILMNLPAGIIEINKA